MRVKEILNYPTFDQIMALPIGRVVTVGLREVTGERAELTGLLHTSTSGVRKVGPVIIATSDNRFTERPSPMVPRTIAYIETFE